MVAGGAQTQVLSFSSFLSAKGIENFIGIHNSSESDLPPTQRIINVGGERFRYLSILRNYLQVLLTEKPDVVVAYGLNAALIMEFCCFITRTRLIVSERNSKPRTGRIPLRIRRFCHLLADRMFVNSNEQQAILADSAPFLKTSVIKNTLPGSFLNINWSSSRKPAGAELKILGIGKYLPQKNLDYVLDILELYQSKFPNDKFCLDWYGDVDGEEKVLYRCRLKKKVEVKNLCKNIRLNGPSANVCELYQQADVLLFPSLHEGTPNVVIEAMSQGLPVCISDCSNSGDLIKDGVNGFVVGLSEPNKWVSSLRQIRRWQERDLVEANRYSINKIRSEYGEGNFEKLLTMIKELVHG